MSDKEDKKPESRADKARRDDEAKQVIKQIDHACALTGAHTAERKGDDAAAIAIELVREISMQLMERKYPDLRWAEGELVKFDRSGDPGFDSFRWYELDTSGEADFINDQGDGAPTVDLKLTAHDSNYAMFGIKMIVTDRDIDRAKTQGLFNIAEKKSKAAKRAYMQKLHRLVLEGDETRGFSGMQRLPGTYDFAIDNAAVGGVGTWISASPATVSDDLTRIFNVIYNGSETVLKPDTVIFPSNLAGRFHSLQNSVASDVVLIDFLKRVFDNSNEFPIKNWIFDRTMNTAAVGGGQACLVYNSDSENLQAKLPVDFKPARAQQKEMHLEQKWWGMYGGIQLFQPKAFAIVNGI